MYGALLNNSSLSAGQPTERKKPAGVILCTVGFKWLHKSVTQHLSSTVSICTVLWLQGQITRNPRSMLFCCHVESVDFFRYFVAVKGKQSIEHSRL